MPERDSTHLGAVVGNDIWLTQRLYACLVRISRCKMKKQLWVAGGIAVIIALQQLGAEVPELGSDGSSTVTNKNLISATDGEAKKVARTSPSSNWSYMEDKDEMREASVKRAVLVASKPISLAFPYGASTPELTVRSDPKFGSDVYISANAQFLCRSHDDDTISVKFDQGPIEEWACADADSGSRELIFVQRQQAFVERLKKAKQVIIEAEMYNAGRVQMNFNVAGLKWPPRDSASI